MQGQALVDYVKRVMDLEKDVYTNQQIQNSFDETFARRKPLPPPKPEIKKIYQPSPPKLNDEDKGKKIASALGYWLCAIGCIWFMRWMLSEDVWDLLGFIGVVGLLVISALTIGSVYLAINSQKEISEKKRKYQEDMDSYPQRLAEYNEAVKQTTAENIEKQRQYGSALTEYLQETDQYECERKNAYAQISTSGQKLRWALSSLYDMNVLYPKYRNLVAVSTIYEYLSSGRCDRLDGPDGAYNLYEMELRQNIIIGQLSSIVENLNQIRNNQFTLYNELVSANQRAASVLSDIGNNVKISAYQNEAAAKNAEALKYISLIKH